MTVLRDAIDTTTLGWVKPELDETLRQARQEIEAYAENPGDTSRMRACADHLHQVHGTLRMVELYAPAMVAEEMERLSLALQLGQVADRDDACAALMRGVVLLPDYLERLQGGHRDIPIVLLPLLNELRAARGEPGLNESVLFSPDLDRPLPQDLPAPATASRQGGTQLGGAASGRACAKRWPPGPRTARRSIRRAWPTRSTACSATSCSSRCVACCGSPRRSPARCAMAHCRRRAPCARPSPASSAKPRQILSDDDFGAPRSEPAAEPTRQLLYHVAHSDGRHPALDHLRETFELDAHLPSESELEHARGSLSGRNRALLDTVSAAIKEDLLRVKDALDLHLRTGQTDVADLQPQVEALGRVGDTLGMMGLGVARNVVLQQRDAMREIVSGRPPRRRGRAARRRRRAALRRCLARRPGQPPRPARRQGRRGPAGQRVAQGARRGRARGHRQLRRCPPVLRRVRGNQLGPRRTGRSAAPARRSLRRAAHPRTGAAGRLPGRHQALHRSRADRPPARAQRPAARHAGRCAGEPGVLPRGAARQRPNRDKILDIARQSLEALGYWPLPDAELRAVADHRR